MIPLDLEPTDEHVFVAILGGGAAGHDCAALLRQAGISFVQFDEPMALTEIECDPSRITLRACDQTNQRSSGLHSSLRFFVQGLTAGVERLVACSFLVVSTDIAEHRTGLVSADRLIAAADDPRVASASFFQGKSVAILGSGPAAMQVCSAALVQSPSFLRVFAKPNLVRCDPQTSGPSDCLLEGGFDLFLGTGDAPHFVTSHEDPFSRFAFEYIVVDVDAFPSAGFHPRLRLDRNPAGFIVVDRNGFTSQIGVMAVGCLAAPVECTTSQKGFGVAQAVQTLGRVFSKFA